MPFWLFSILFWIFFIPFSSAQSKCIYMKETSFDLESMPDEPVKNSNLSVCTVSKSTCCTSEIENQMLLNSRIGIERSVQDQIILTRQQFQDFANIFRANFRRTLNQTHQQLHSMFTKSYGPFYLQNREIFDDFFGELDSFFIADYPNSNVKQILVRLFRKLYIKIFELLNPLREVGEIEKECLVRLQNDLKPFGSYPHKIALLMERAFVAWKSILKSIDQSNEALFKLLNDVGISSECAKAVSRMQQCHVCSGASPLSRPCSGFCLNVLKGCFAEFAEIDPQWNSLIETFVLFGDRLKTAYNPINVLAPLPAQISEAIMHYQEKGHHFSNRMILQCFSLSLKDQFRMKREVIETRGDSNSISFELKIESFESDEDDEIPRYSKKPDPVKESINLFIDRLIRMKNFWRSLPDAICTEKRIVASSGESCWNGYSMGKYGKKVVGDGIASQRKNPEFFGNFQGSKESYIDERIQFSILSDKLTSLYYGKKSKTDIPYEGSGNPDFLDGSGLPPIDDEDAFNDVNYHLSDDSFIQHPLPSSTSSRISISITVILLLNYL